MKKLFLMVMAALFTVGVYAQTRQGESSIGITGGYGFDNESGTLGVDYRYNITDGFRINPGYTHVFKNDGISANMVDLDFHYAIPLSEMFVFYPLVGASLSFWKLDYDHVHWHGQLDKDDTKTRFGGNIGAGVELYASEQFTIGVEFRYNLIHDFDQSLLGLRLGYNF
ncbi:MAG: porin family protein [Tannerellaceae bacterium]|nr:porin family protein [Tannerellaceae bacterium]MCD8263706.1 porin family protein [Tannerellaceae bacterium]